MTVDYSNNHLIYCPQCPAWYDPSVVQAQNSAGEWQPFEEVMLSVSSSNSKSLFRRRPRPVDPQAIRERAAIVAEGWKPYCPENHPLSDSLEPPRVIGIIGNVLSSKTHYLVGLVNELINRQSLHLFNADISYIGDTGQEMAALIRRIYIDKEVLPSTERGAIGGPFTYRLTIGDPSESRSYVLVFFDVAGEDCSRLQASATIARYLFSAVGIVILIDPDGIPNPDQPLVARGAAPLADRSIIDILADGISRVTGVMAFENSPTIAIAVAKADSVSWNDGEYPPAFWPWGSSTRGHLGPS
jgi:hypothetical protein